MFKLLRADAHRWGAGSVHRIDAERDQTMCGKTPANCPGTPFDGYHDDITCKVCLRAIDSRANQAEAQREYLAQAKARETERIESNRKWWAAYGAYLESATWKTKRRRVLDRAKGTCEGCGEHRATQVHHMRYPACYPGSAEWISQEKLFDLKAICKNCHSDIHPHIRTEHA